MNQGQVAQQLAYILRVLAWSGGTNPVFGRVAITDRPMADALGYADRPPIALVRIGGADHDEEFPEVIASMTFTIDIAARVDGDTYGELSIIGGARPDFSKSGGAGVAEVVARALSTIGLNGAQTGLTILSKSVSSGPVTFDVGGVSFAMMSIGIEAKGSTADYYHPARKLANAVGTLSWTNPPTRFDLHAAVSNPGIAARGSLILRYAAGSTPPASATAGNGATLSGPLATSYVHGADGQGSGTFSYALFGGYDRRGTGIVADYQYSKAVTLTGSF